MPSMMVTPRTITALVIYPEGRVNLAGVPTRPFGVAGQPLAATQPVRAVSSGALAAGALAAGSAAESAAVEQDATGATGRTTTRGIERIGFD